MRRAWLLALLLAAGCEGESRVEIRDRRVATDPRPVPDASAEERFRVAEMFDRSGASGAGDQQQGQPSPGPTAAPSGHDHGEGEPHLQFDLPPGWERLARTPMRLINLKAPGDTACWVTFLPGGGGGLLANVNRWRNQLGAAPIDDAALAALPRVPLLGRPALWFELDGQPGKPERFLGLLVELPTGLLTVKLVGPPAAAEANREPLLRFAASLREGH